MRSPKLLRRSSRMSTACHPACLVLMTILVQRQTSSSSSRRSCCELAIGHAGLLARMHAGPRCLGASRTRFAARVRSCPRSDTNVPETLAAIDDAFALQLLVCALHGDEAHQQLFREHPERWQRRCPGQPVRSDFALHRVHDLLIERPGAAGEIGPRRSWGGGHVALYISSIDSRASAPPPPLQPPGDCEASGTADRQARVVLALIAMASIRIESQAGATPLARHLLPRRSRPEKRTQPTPPPGSPPSR